MKFTNCRHCMVEPECCSHHLIRLSDPISAHSKKSNSCFKATSHLRPLESKVLNGRSHCSVDPLYALTWLMHLQELTIEEAFEAEVLQLDPVSIVDANGERYSLAEATSLGLVEPRTAKQILKALEPYALQKYIDRQEIDPQTGDYVDIKNREVREYWIHLLLYK